MYSSQVLNRAKPSVNVQRYDNSEWRSIMGRLSALVLGQEKARLRPSSARCASVTVEACWPTLSEPQSGLYKSRQAAFVWQLQPRGLVPKFLTCVLFQDHVVSVRLYCMHCKMDLANRLQCYTDCWVSLAYLHRYCVDRSMGIQNILA